MWGHRVLRAQGIRFQTPHPVKLRVFLDSGTQVYESAAEAAEDLQKRGLPVENVKEPVSAAGRQQRMATWLKAGVDHRRKVADHGRIRERLRSFQRNPPGASVAGEGGI